MIDRITPSRIAAPSVADARAPHGVAPKALDAEQSATPVASSLTSEPRRMAAEGPPIDGARVERLRAALLDGSFAVDPERIAAAMIAGERGA